MTIVLRGPTHLQVASPRLDKRLPGEQSRIENGDRDAYLCLHHKLPTCAGAHKARLTEVEAHQRHRASAAIVDSHNTDTFSLN